MNALLAKNDMDGLRKDNGWHTLQSVENCGISGPQAVLHPYRSLSLSLLSNLCRLVSMMLPIFLLVYSRFPPHDSLFLSSVNLLPTRYAPYPLVLHNPSRRPSIVYKRPRAIKTWSRLCFFLTMPSIIRWK